MTKYNLLGDKVMVLSDMSARIVDKLPAEVYSLHYNEMMGYHLSRVEEFIIPEKRYGGTDRTAERVIQTFKARPQTTGALLSGVKGSGKTMTVKVISKMALAMGLPVIMINEAHVGGDFISFVQSIQCECVFVFDEFEKTYDRKQQDSILTLLDGVAEGKKLFLFTANNINLLSDFMMNRPGRIYYSIEFHGLEEDFIREYCIDCGVSENRIKQIITVAGLFHEFNFDMLKTICEESKRFPDEPIRDMLMYLNIKPDKASPKFRIVVEHNGMAVPQARYYPTEAHDVFSAHEITISMQSEGSEDYDTTLSIQPMHESTKRSHDLSMFAVKSGDYIVKLERVRYDGTLFDRIAF